jgi:uncharacterized membrane protein YgcG
MIKDSSVGAADRVSVRAVLRGAPTAPKPPPRLRTKALVGWLIYCSVAVGGTAAAFTVRDTLFPALGSPAPKAVWGNDDVSASETTEHNSTPAPATDAVDQPVLVATDPSVTAVTSVDDATVPSASNEGPGSSIDRHGPGTQTGPGTTVDDNPNRGPGPGTTVDDHDPEATSPSIPDDDDDPATTTATTTPDPTAPTTTVGDNSGKGKGGGGGGDSGGGSGGGGGNPSTP